MTTVASRLANLVRDRLGSPASVRSSDSGVDVSDSRCGSVEKDADVPVSSVSKDADNKLEPDEEIDSILGSLVPWSPWQW